MSKLRRLVVLLIFGLSALVVIGNARSIEQGGSIRHGESVATAIPAALADQALAYVRG